VENNLKATEKDKEYHDRKAKPHTYCEGQKVLLEEYYFLGKNTKLAPKWSGPHVILSLKGTHNVELLVHDKKKVIVKVDRRIKPYRIPDSSLSQEVSSKVPASNKYTYNFDGEEFIPSKESIRKAPETDSLIPEAPNSEPDQIPPEVVATPESETPETRKRGRPQKINTEN
jgi:hypothetical protein